MRTRIRRVLPAAVALSLGTALLMTPSTAHAAAPVVLDSNLWIEGEAHDDEDCSGTGFGDGYVEDSSTSGNLSLSLSAGVDVAHPGNPADVGTGSVSGQAALITKVTGSALSVKLDASLQMTTSTELPDGVTNCRVHAYGGIGGSVSFRVFETGAVTLNLGGTTDRGNVGLERYADAAYDEYVGELALYGKMPALTAQLEPGFYRIYLNSWSEDVYAPALSGETSSGSESATISASFAPPPPPPAKPAVKKGVAQSKAKGTGKKFVKLPATINCDARSATLKFTKRAKKVKKATVLAGKKKLRTIKAPKKGKITVKKIPAKSTKLTVKLKLKNSKSAKVVRAYTAC